MIRARHTRGFCWAVSLVEEAERVKPLTWSWPFAERVAGLYMHLGRPAEARRIWQAAVDCPFEGLRQSRLAQKHWVEQTSPRRCVISSPQRTRIHNLRIRDGAVRCCTHGLAPLKRRLKPALDLTSRQRADIERLQSFLPPTLPSR